MPHLQSPAQTSREGEEKLQENELNDLSEGESVISHHGNKFNSQRSTYESKSCCEKEADEEDVYHASNERWVVLSALSMLILTHSIARIAFSPVAYTSAGFYRTEVSVINWFAIVYMILGFPVGFVTPLILEKKGVRFSLIFGAWVNLIGNALRCVSAISGLEQFWRLPLVFSGHVLSALVQPLFMFSPSLVASLWFGENQRALANSIASICNPLGVLIAFLSSPTLVQEPSDVPKMLLIHLIPTALGTLLATFGIRRNKPETPPSASANIKNEDYFSGLKKLCRNKQYWLLFFCVGAGIAIFTVITVFMEQMMCPWGYSDYFSGVVCGSCLILSGILGAGLSGLLVDRTKQFVSMTKTTFSLCIAGLGMFVFYQNHKRMHAVIATSCAVMGFFGLPLLPLGNELAVEMTYPIDPSTSSGMLFLGGQLQSVMLISVVQNVATPLTDQQINSTSCHSWKESHDHEVMITDLTIPCYILLGYGCLVAIVLLLLLKTDYKRLNAEQNKRIVSSNAKDVSTS